MTVAGPAFQRLAMLRSAAATGDRDAGHELVQELAESGDDDLLMELASEAPDQRGSPAQARGSAEGPRTPRASPPSVVTAP